MREPLDEQAMADLLPGAWSVAATNLPVWLSGDRRDRRLEYAVLSRDPLVLTDDVGFTAGPGKRGGTSRHIVGRDTWRGDQFVWRGTGMLAMFTSRWRVAGASDDGSIAVIVFTKSLGAPAGVDIIVREGSVATEVRAVIAHATDDFGLSPEQFGSLSWFRPNATT